MVLCSRINYTPGFDNSNKEDVDIPKIIADWLKSTYVLVVNPQHYCFDVISADMKWIFCSATSSTFIEYLTIKCRSIYTCTFSRNSAAKALSIRSILTTTMWDKVIEEIGEKCDCECSNCAQNALLAKDVASWFYDKAIDSLRTRQINFRPHRTFNRSSKQLKLVWTSRRTGGYAQDSIENGDGIPDVIEDQG